jgi:hypothetical protein
MKQEFALNFQDNILKAAAVASKFYYFHVINVLLPVL